MYTQENVRKLFMQRGEIEMELKVRQARYYGREEEMPREEAARILELKQELLTIDGLFAALSENEAFVIRHHVMEELDWPADHGAVRHEMGSGCGKIDSFYESFAREGIEEGCSDT